MLDDPAAALLEQRPAHLQLSQGPLAVYMPARVLQITCQGMPDVLRRSAAQPAFQATPLHLMPWL